MKLPVAVPVRPFMKVSTELRSTSSVNAWQTAPFAEERILGFGRSTLAIDLGPRVGRAELNIFDGAARQDDDTARRPTPLSSPRRISSSTCMFQAKCRARADIKQPSSAITKPVPYPGCGAVICVATNRRRRCSPDVVGSYFGASPGRRQVGIQATGAS